MHIDKKKLQMNKRLEKLIYREGFTSSQLIYKKKLNLKNNQRFFKLKPQ